MEHIRRATHGKGNVYGATIALMSDSNGNKFGKSMDNGQNLWLDAEKTSPYNFYQFLMNIPDSDVGDLLTKLTFIDINEINIIMQQHLENPHLREA